MASFSDRMHKIVAEIPRQWTFLMIWKAEIFDVGRYFVKTGLILLSDYQTVNLNSLLQSLSVISYLTNLTLLR